MGKTINPNLKLKSRTLKSPASYLADLVKGDRFVLSEVLTLIESTNAHQRKIGESILSSIDTSSSSSIRIGVTGSPGAGKSTFIEALGCHLTAMGYKIAVLAIDPSSTISQGSILGDKTRMQQLSTDPNAFVRPTASANILGGVSRATKESITICEAAGYDFIIIESVGVGQSETVLADLVDCYLVLLLPGGGDGVQGIKRGVMELADIMVINKNDGDQKLVAKKSQQDFASAVRLFHHPLPEWKVPVQLVSSIDKTGIAETWDAVTSYISQGKATDYLDQKRTKQDQKWLENQIRILMMTKATSLFKSALEAAAEQSHASVFSKLTQIATQIDNSYQQYTSK